MLSVIFALLTSFGAAGLTQPPPAESATFTFVVKQPNNRVQFVAKTTSKGAVCRRLSMHRIGAEVLIKNNHIKLTVPNSPSPLYTHCQTRFILDAELRNLKPGTWTVELSSVYRFESVLSILVKPLTLAKLNAQGKQQYKIEQTAYKMYDAFTKGDYKTYRQYLYPELLKHVNEETLKADVTRLQKGPDGLKRYLFFQRKRIQVAGDQLQALVERHSLWQVEGKPMNLRSHLLALSNDRGQTWTFVEVNALTDERIKKLKLSLDLKLRKELYCFNSDCRSLTK